MAGTDSLRLVLMLPQCNRIVTPDAVLRTAEAADEMGFYGVSVRDHISYNGWWISSGTVDTDVEGDDRDFYESMQTLAFVASRTERVKLATSVTVLPNRHPVLFAKQAATLDMLSGGRLILGVGVGPPSGRSLRDTRLSHHRTNAEKEYDAFDIPGNRGRRTDEYLEAVFTIWSEESATYHGEYVSFENLDMFPKPLQQPRPRILIGGNSDLALRRAARYGDGWNPSQMPVERYSETADRLRGYFVEENRVGPAILGINNVVAVAASDEIAHAQAYPTASRIFHSEEAYRARTLVGSPETFAARLRAYRDAGVNWVEMRPVYPTVDNLIEQMRLITEEVLPAVADGP